jgi:alpha-ketoglutarate-dependent taurine dioxygenase
MAYHAIDLTPRIGTEIRADRNTLIGGEHGQEFRQLLEKRGVLVLRDMFFTADEQRKFARSIGQIQPQGDDGIFKITIDPKENPGAEYIKGSFFWHIDGASDDVPNLAALLNPQVLSKTGGNTYFANTYAAYDHLPADERQNYDNLRVVHSFEASQRYVNPEPCVAELTYWQSREDKVHPLVWNHRSGRKSFVIGCTASHVEDMDYKQGRMILSRLREWATQPQFVYCHEWQMGDILVWDNSGTMHRVDEYPLEEGRLMLRTTIEAEEALV